MKPHNVLVDGEGRARVTDFGIARAGASEMTQTGSVLGTAQYLSPEQAQGFDVTATSDLYSIGVILYEALTGRVPFEADTAVAIALKQVSERPRKPSELNPKVSPALDAVTLKALAKDPADRFQTADEFIRALDAAENDPSGGSLGDTAAYAAAAGAGALAGAALAQGDEAPTEPDAEDEEAKKKRRRKLIALGVVAALILAVVIFALTRSQQVTVPTVIGETQEDATGILEDAGFEVLPSTFESCNEPQTVSEQNPRAGTEADEGSTVEISVSLGLRVPVPDVVGKPTGEATQILADEQLQTKERRTLLGQRRGGQGCPHRARGRGPGRVPVGGQRVHIEGRAAGDRAGRAGPAGVDGRGGGPRRRPRAERRDRELRRAGGHRHRRRSGSREPPREGHRGRAERLERGGHGGRPERDRPTGGHRDRDPPGT